MGAWAYVSLAYGIVSALIAVYWLLLKRRYHAAEAEIERLNSLEATRSDVKK